jgi:hypothetical protein
MDRIPFLDEIAADRIAGMLHYADARRKSHPSELEQLPKRRRRRPRLVGWLLTPVRH